MRDDDRMCINRLTEVKGVGRMFVELLREI